MKKKIKNKIKNKLVTTLIVIIVSISSCDPIDEKFIIINNTPNTISYYFSKDSTEQSALKFYSEKFYVNSQGGKIKKEFDYVKSKDEKPIPMMINWEDYLNYEFKERRGVYLYVIDSSDINKEVDVMQNSKLVRRYEITSNYMKANQWRFEIK